MHWPELPLVITDLSRQSDVFFQYAVCRLAYTESMIFTARGKTMKLGYTIIYVPNVIKAVEYYERCFGIQRRFVDDSGDYGELDTGATCLAFVSEKLASSSISQYRPNTLHADPAGIEIVFVTDDVQTAFDTAVQQGAVAVMAPVKKPWGQVISYVRDLNGVIVEIGSEIS